MGFQPIVSGTGLVAWRTLQRTMPAQLDAFAAAPDQRRLTEHFKAAAPELRTADDIAADRRSMTVALGAFGLQDDINNTYFVKRILAEGAEDPASLASRMSDSRYARLSRALAMDGLTQFTGVLEAAAENISSEYIQQSFAIAVGDSQPGLRLALNADRELSRIADMKVSEDAKWYLVMGNPPLRTVMEKALGLPSSFGRLDIEQQLDVFRDQAQKAFGHSEVTDLAQNGMRDDLIDRYILKDQLTQGDSLSSQNIALQLLSV